MLCNPMYALSCLLLPPQTEAMTRASDVADFVLDHILSRAALSRATELFSYSIGTHIAVIFTFVLCIVTIAFTKKGYTGGDKKGRGKCVAFFHPYCNSGGGGERVLWIAVEALLLDGSAASIITGRSRSNSRSKKKKKKKKKGSTDSSHGISCSESEGSRSRGRVDRIYIYSGDLGIPKRQILENVRTRFQIDLLSDPAFADSIEIAYIHSRWLLEASNYPVATMFFQSFASIVVGLECLLLHIIPDVYIDTTGAAFIYPFVKLLSLGRCYVNAYVHYPIISSDMLKIVREKRPQYNNRSVVATSVVISSYKLLYYQVFTHLYRFVGGFADLVFVNSTWTRNHIQSLWNMPVLEDGDNAGVGLGLGRKRRCLVLVHPPCNTDELQGIPIVRKGRERYILSIGQFRPEKDHLLQLLSFEKLKNTTGKKSSTGPKKKYENVKLVLLGSTRNEEDDLFVRNLKVECDKLNLTSDVVFVVNCDFDTMTKWLSKAHIGLHTMWNEHFGISIVEMMAAGLAVVAHDSGGPRMDIVTTYKGAQTGYLASTSDEYAAILGDIVDNFDTQKISDLRQMARDRAREFSDEKFRDKYRQHLYKMQCESL